MNGRRVVVTGLGIVSPLGLTVSETWKNILAGKSGVSTVTSFDVSQLSSRISASVEGFDPAIYGISVKDQRKMDRFIQYGLGAAAQALQDAALTVTDQNATRIGVAIGSGIGGLPVIEKSTQTLLEEGPRRISPFFVPSAIINMISGHISIQYGFRGPNLAIVTACTTGTHNMGQAARMIAYGDADVMVTGGAEMATSPLGLGGFAACRALSTRNDEPTRASRPWDKDRDGFVLGDGAGVIVLEAYEHAKQRGATIYAELIGFGMSGDAYHMTLPEPSGRGGVDAMQCALNDAKLNPDAVHYINAHATSTSAGDDIEAIAIQKTFGKRQNLAVSSTKSMTGHLLGAAGAVEAIFSILAIRDQVAPPTINLDHPEKDYGIDFVPHHAKPMKIDVALSNSFGFGGTNGTLIFKKI